MFAIFCEKWFLRNEVIWWKINGTKDDCSSLYNSTKEAWLCLSSRGLIFGSGSVNTVRQMQAGNASKLLELSRIHTAALYHEAQTNIYKHEYHLMRAVCTNVEGRKCIYTVYSSVRVFYTLLSTNHRIAYYHIYRCAHQSL